MSIITQETFPELFELPLWQQASRERVQEIAEAVVIKLGEKYKVFSIKMPTDTTGFPQVLFCYIPTNAGFYLVVGGSFEMGLSQEEYEKLDIICRKAEAYSVAQDETANNDLPFKEPTEWLPDPYFLREYLKKASIMQPARLVTIPPFLMAKGVWGLKNLKAYVTVEPNVSRLYQYDEKNGYKEDCVFYFTGPELQQLGLKFGNWELPSEAMWEYAYRGGKKNNLYYWGDTPFHLDIFKSYEVKEEHPFGLKIFGDYEEACADDWRESYEGAPSDGSARIVSTDKPCRVTRGGAADMWPWQDCGEWLLQLCATRRRIPLFIKAKGELQDCNDAACVRPIIRLV